MANYGKISRLPADLRNEVCLRLYNGEGSAAILPWLNADVSVQKVLSAQFDGEPITAQNLSAWKQNEYAQWLRRRQKVQDLKELSCFASDLVGKSKNLAGGGSAILAGKLLEVIDDFALDAGDEDAAEKLTALAGALSKLRAGELAAAKLANENRRLKNDEARLALERKKFERATCELFIKWCADEKAKEIALGDDRQTVKIEQLRKLMFGGRPDGK